MALPQEREYRLNLPPPDPFAKQHPLSPDLNPPLVIYNKEADSDLAAIQSYREPKYKVEYGVASDINDRNTEKTVELRPEYSTKFNWKPALTQAAMFLGIQHGFRFLEIRTREELDGPFLRDWKESVMGLRGWDDGGKIFTNYIAHPLQGSVTGRIFVNNSPKSQMTEFSRSKAYWMSRMKAMVWSAVWSTQFELGPISEASLGNVGQKPTSNGKSKMSYSDLVITPVAGTGMLIAEDAIDKFILRNCLERMIDDRLAIKILRTVLTPMTSVANMLRFRLPWYRDDRLRMP